MAEFSLTDLLRDELGSSQPASGSRGVDFPLDPSLAPPGTVEPAEDEDEVDDDVDDDEEDEDGDDDELLAAQLREAGLDGDDYDDPDYEENEPVATPTTVKRGGGTGRPRGRPRGSRAATGGITRGTPRSAKGKERAGSDDEAFDPREEAENDRHMQQLISALRASQGDRDRGLLGQDWDRSLDVELSELQDLRRTKTGRRRRPRGDPELSQEVSYLIGRANLSYVTQDFDAATAGFEEVLRIEPTVRAAWNALAKMADERGEWEKGLKLEMIAAHLTPSPAEAWKALAVKSRNHSLLSQAIYCFNEAIRTDRSDVEAMWDRSYLLHQVGKSKQALNGYLSILKVTPHSVTVIDEIVQLCASLDDLETGTLVLQSAFDHYRHLVPGPTSLPRQRSGDAEGVEEDALNGFSIDHVRTLTDFLLAQKLYHRAIDTAKIGQRWLQGRADQTAWDRSDDDREYDEARRMRPDWESKTYLESFPVYDLDVGLRTMVGLARLHLGQEQEAHVQFDIVLLFDAIEYPEYFRSIADAHFDLKNWDMALEIYEDLLEYDSTNKPDVWARVGECHRRKGELDEAIQSFEAVIEADEMDLQAKMTLAEIYEEKGDRTRALALVNDVLDARRRAKETDTVLEKDVAMPRKHRGPRYAERPKTAAERRALEARLTAEYGVAVTKLQALQERVEADDPVALAEWLGEAGTLIDGFRETRALFPQDFNRKFMGVIRKYRKRKNLDEQADDLAGRLARDDDSDDVPVQEAATEFRGVDLAVWHDMFIRYAFYSIKADDAEAGVDALSHAMSSAPFRQAPHWQQSLRLAHVAASLAIGDFDGVTETCRWIAMRLLYHSEPIRLFHAALGSGVQAGGQFGHANILKWAVRGTRRIEAVAAGQKFGSGPSKRGFALTTADPNNPSRDTPDDEDEDDDDESELGADSTFTPTKMNPTFVALVAEVLLTARSYQPAIMHLLRIYDVYPDDPLTNLMLGIAYAHRAMQRQTDNRHYQLMLALAHLDRYRKVRQEAHPQEVDYNVGRLFHHLGLMDLAVKHYETVLAIAGSAKKDDPDDYTAYTAYNLMLIYTTTGAPNLARALSEKYLQI